MTRAEGHQVLVVEDDPDHVLLLRRALRPLKGSLHLEVAPDGQSALERLRAGAHPDLILLDINMPRVSGLEVLEAIKGDPALADIPTVMLTTSAREEDRSASLSRGANEFYTKPVSFRRFSETLLSLVCRYTQLTPTP
ncbi:MAG: response regulator [Myxococcales bacterium]|nr:response regulator [Myxococcales bacterium]MCB9525508.1 response regulator [Myxococcales bacterium]